MDRAQTTNDFESNPGIMYKLGHIEAQLDAINAKLDAKVALHDIELTKLRSDVSALKEWRMLQLGVAAAISFVIGIITKVLPWQNLS
jgi:hypothetical protein